VELVPEVDSTNTELVRRARLGAPHGLVLVADHQTAGRGRLGRSWEAAPDSALLVSVLLRPDLDPDRLHLSTWAAGLAACDAVADLGCVDAGLKWPNDVLVGDGKLAGILAESVIDAGRVTAVVVGMGLNLRHPGAEGAVALDALLAAVPAREEILERWLAHFDRWTGAPEADVGAAYRARSATIGRTVAVETAHDRSTGVAVDVDDRGHLVLDDGRRFAVADVVHLRAG
jgi:BirA family biotin operon repressor/biotin-[acetyl-CoA-carboxylase] ligase